MKIGIIGLQPRQIADVRKRTFNGHEVEFYGEKTYSQEKVAAFVRRVDKVIWLPGHTPKRLDEWITKTKLLQTMAGGISSVVRLLDSIPSDASAEPLVPLRTSKSEPVIEDRPTPAATIKPPKKLGQTIPQGRTSLYEWSPEEQIVRPNASGEHRYDLLDAAVPGDVLRMARPEGVDYQPWRVRITSMRYSREKNKGQILEAHYYEEYVDLLVVETKEEGVWQKDATAERKSSPGEITNAVGMAAEEQSSTTEAPTVETPELSVPAPTVKDLLVIADKVERSFWENAVLVGIGRGLSAADAAVMADLCVKEQRLRFTGEK